MPQGLPYPYRPRRTKKAPPKPPNKQGKFAGGKPKVVTTKTKSQTSSSSGKQVGFNPQEMARTLTDLGYNAQLAAIQRAIEQNARDEMAALANIRDWTAQIEGTRAAGAASVGNVWNQAVAGAGESAANIGALFGEDAAGEAAQFSGAGTDMLRAMGANDQSFMAMMGPILQAQGADHAARARSDFGRSRGELTGQLSGLTSEKAEAYNKNLLDMMQLGWQRESQMFEREGQLFDQRMASLQARQAQQALNQANKLFGPQLEAAKLQNEQTRQGIRLAEQNARIDAEMSDIQKQQAQQALRRGEAEINQILQGEDPESLDPGTLNEVAMKSVAGTLNPRGVLSMNPRVAWNTAMRLLGTYGLDGNPQAVAAAWNAFQVALNQTHARGGWRRWKIKSGKLVYSPAARNENAYTGRTKGPGRGD